MALKQDNTTQQELEDFLKETDREIINFAEKYQLYPEREPHWLYKYAKERMYEGGKRFRPALAFAACLAFNGNKNKAVPFGYICEAIHAGYVDIDDVFDRSPKRRDKPATWKEIGNERATLVGLLNSDAMPWKALAIGIRDYEWDLPLVADLAELIGYHQKEETIEGESLDLDYRKNEELSPGEQMLIYIRKTSSYTVGAPMAGGARIANASSSTVDELFRLGRDYLGPGFQIRDDVLNLCKDITGYGKEFADDLNEGKPTMVVAVFNERASEVHKKKFHNKFGRMNLTMEERERLVRLLNKYDALEESLRKAEELLSYGIGSINSIVPRNEKSKIFYALLEFAVRRKR